jgi:hypothetical protein
MTPKVIGDAPLQAGYPVRERALNTLLIQTSLASIAARYRRALPRRHGLTALR